MALFLIERNFAEELQASPELVAAVKQVNSDVGINWLFSFLSADKRKTYCLYEAKNPEAIREAVRRLNAPADTIVELGDMRSTPPRRRYSRRRAGLSYAPPLSQEFSTAWRLSGLPAQLRDLFRERFHPETLRGGSRGIEQCESATTIGRRSSFKKHRGVFELGVG